MTRPKVAETTVEVPAEALDAIASTLPGADGIQLPVGNWRRRARCRDLDPETFFPAPSDRVQIEAAKRVCDLCVVREQCLQLALAIQKSDWEVCGIFGGLDEAERRALQRRLRERQACRTPRRPRRW